MIDPETVEALRARVELELACGATDILMPPGSRTAIAMAPRAGRTPAAPAQMAAAPPEPSPGEPRDDDAREVAARSPPAPLPLLRDGDPTAAAARLAARARELAPCTLCGLSRARTQVVYGTGDARARLMFVGEGPGADEDRLGEPFVGRAGQLLDKIIEAMGLRRADVYIANVVKCRPPQNRVPTFEEVQACFPFLLEQIEILGPEVLVALGATAARALLGTQASMGSLRGRFHEWKPPGGERRIPLLCTYHPAYLLRNPADKRKVWEDMQLVMKRLALPIPERRGEGARE